MVFTLLILLAVSVLGLAGLSAAKSGLTLSSNYKSSAQAEQAAESGLVHAVTVVNSYGVVKFTDLTQNSDSSWNSIFGSSAMQFPSYSSISYAVTPSASSATSMTLASTGTAPGQSSRTVSARLALGNPFTCGAIDLPGSGVSATFNGNNFVVDGNDYTMGGSLTGNASTLGISTRTQTDANSIISSLSSGQQDNVTGTVVPGQVASVNWCSGPSSTRIANEIVPAILAQPNALISTNPETKVTGQTHFGTLGNPQITHFTSDTLIAAGDASGYGIMIVDGSLRITGNLTFTGLIIVSGSTQIETDPDNLEVEGSASIYGAIWSSDLFMTVGGHAGVRYSLDALEYANSMGGNNQTTQKLLPQRISVQSWSQG